MINDDATRISLKAELLPRLEALGLEQALFPSTQESIDEILRRLENLNPIKHPLNSSYLPSLIGDWQLVYASRGTVVTRPLASLPNFGGGIKLTRVWQKLGAGDTNQILASNNAIFDLPLLGEWKVQADGVWIGTTDEQTAKVSFSSFAVQATKLLGLSQWSLPELKIPVLEFLRNEAVWITSYLGET
jgi:hypothetical protein